MARKVETRPMNVVAITSGAAAVNGGGEVVFHEGEIYGADDPLVRQFPLFFVPADSTTAQVHEARVARGLYHRVLY
jgi:hypothetical protein